MDNAASIRPTLMWGLAGNSAADSAAKSALLMPVSSWIVPHLDYNSLIRIQAIRQWPLRWNSASAQAVFA